MKKSTSLLNVSLLLTLCCLIALVAISSAPSSALASDTLGPKQSAACAQLDNPAIRPLMSGMYETRLLRACGRSAELGQVTASSESKSPLLGVDVQVNDSTGESGVTQTQSETSMVRNENTGTICSAYNDSYSGVILGQGYAGLSRSTNGGVSFTDRGALSSASYGDPSLIWRRLDGYFYIASIHSSGGMGLWRSTDECQTFQYVGLAHAGSSDDKELLTVDNNPASSHYGRIYMGWTDFAVGARIFSTYSDNTTSWSTPVALSASGVSVQGAWPTVAPNGDVYMAWVRWDPYYSGPISIEVARSTNGGVSYSLVTNPMSGQVNPYDATATGACGRPALKANIRYLPSPQITVSPNGDLHVVYTYDVDGRNVGDVVNVYYRRSTNSGASWQPEIQLNDDGTTRDQFFPTVSAGPSGRIIATWYDRRLDSNNTLFDYYMRASDDGGATWSPSQRVSDVSSPVYLDPNLATCYHGDYDQQLQDASYAYIQWSDDHVVRSGHADPDVWFDKTAFAPDFTIAAAPASQNICAPSDALYTVTVGQVQGFADPVTLSAAGYPGGATAAFSPNPVTPPGASTLTIGNTGAAAAGAYAISITGTSGALVHSTNVALNLFTGAPGAVTLLTPVDGAANQSLTPTFTWTAAAQGENYTLEIATDAGFSNIVYTATVATTSHLITTPLNTLSTYYWRVRPQNLCGMGAYSAVFSFSTRDVPAILLVDDDNNSPDVRGYYTTALTALGQDYDVWDTGGTDNEPDLATLNQYKLVVWFSGVAFGGSAGPGPAAETALGSYLSAAGQTCLFLSAQDYHYDRGQTPFMTTYLGATSMTDDVSQTTLTGKTIFRGKSYTLAYPFSNYSDSIVKARRTYTMFNGNFGTAVIAKVDSTNSYVTMFWAAPWEAVPTVQDRQDTIAPIINKCVVP